jgi:hypothetical protein
MTTSDAERHVDPLGRYWNEVVAGEPAAPTDLDPDLAATVRRVQALGSSPVPDPAFAAHLWEDLMNTARFHDLAGPFPIPRPAAIPRLRPDPPENVDAPNRWFGRGRWMPRFELAAAALLVLVLAAGLLAQGGDLRGRVGSFLAQDDDTGESEPRPELQGIYHAPPADQGPVEVTIRRVTLAPGATWENPGVVSMAYVTSGVLTWGSAIPGAEDQLLKPGDSLSVEHAATFRNDGTEPTVLLQAAVGPGIRTAAQPPGVTIEEMGGGEVGALPADSALVTLTSHDFAIDEGQHFDTGRGGLALVIVEDGTLAISGIAGEVVLTRENRAATASPAASASGQPPAPVQLTTGDSALLRGGAFFGIVNPGPNRVRSMVLTLDPGAAQTQNLGVPISEATTGALQGNQEPRSIPTVAAVVIPPDECDVAPRTIESIRALNTGGTPADPAMAGPGDMPHENDLPQGTSVDPATVDAVAAVQRKWVACQNAGDLPRLLALETDAAVRQFVVELVDEWDAILAASLPLPMDQRIALFPLRDARLLPDGRVGAIVEWASADDPFRVDVSLFVVYEQVDGRWLIDETRPFIPNS